MVTAEWSRVEISYQNGETFSGDIEDAPDGEAVVKYPYPYLNTYHGTLQGGKKVGRGVILGDHCSFSCDWRDDKPLGRRISGGHDEPILGFVFATYTTCGGHEYSGEAMFTRSGCDWIVTPHGFGEMQFPTGDVYTGTWHCFMMHGAGRMDYARGETYCGFWRHGMKHGQGRLSSASGGEVQGCWESGTLVGAEV